MKPVIVLVGRPNVGKSTLFNRLVRSRDALVADQPGLTRDRNFGEGRLGDYPYIVVDTGGMGGDEQTLEGLVASQSWLAVSQSDGILFLVDARQGLTVADETIAQQLRATGKPVTLVVNKTDGLDTNVVVAEFHQLGLGMPHAVSATHGRGVMAMINSTLQGLSGQQVHEESPQDPGIKIAIIGRPNVGKSTLVNRMLGEERLLTYDKPGTTRDSIYIPFKRNGIHYTLIDTAGVRRKRSVKEAIEKFSIVKTLKAIEDANVVIMVLDGKESISEQDATLLGFVLDAGRALVMAVNKWDGIDADQRQKIKRELDVKLTFLDFARIHFISALHGTGVGDLYASIGRAYESAFKKIQTPRLTRLLLDLVTAHQPPLVRGRRIKLRYVHQGGHNPPLFVIHGKQTTALPDTYRRYLMNAFCKHLKLEGTPVRLEFKTAENPYKGRRNKLTKRQQLKRKRLMRFVKKK